MVPVAREGREAAGFDVDAASAVWLVLVRLAGLHLAEALVRRDGVDLHPSISRLTIGRLEE